MMTATVFQVRRSPTPDANTASLPVWSTTATVTVTEPTDLPFATAMLAAELAAVDRAASRFRPDSEINQLRRTPGRPVRVSDTLNDLLAGALRIARITGGLVDPTVAAAVVALGYDRDFRELAFMPRLDGPAAVPGIGGIRHDRDAHEVCMPAGVDLDLGATAKAIAADRAAGRIVEEIAGGVLVNLGGDLATAGPAPDGGWRIAIGADHRTAIAEPEQIVNIVGGGLATSATGVRRWTTGRGQRHHIVDPRTGENPPSYWCTASAAAGSCLDANAASTAAIILGADAPRWLTERGVAARLVHVDGSVTTCAGWPSDDAARTAG
jgi:thiamine biosynthesis lipoprotein